MPTPSCSSNNPSDSYAAFGVQRGVLELSSPITVGLLVRGDAIPAWVLALEQNANWKISYVMSHKPATGVWTSFLSRHDPQWLRPEDSLPKVLVVLDDRQVKLPPRNLDCSMLVTLCRYRRTFQDWKETRLPVSHSEFGGLTEAQITLHAYVPSSVQYRASPVSPFGLSLIHI